MASIIEGYNYDIFISYRQKDNKGDRWVSEFVDALKIELESTFKEEISVYFDINPHDGLLETHDVDESLKEKLKCLVFIPIISRTYCDPKSFAWEHEFKAFIQQASHDQFGLKVKLPNGNVASRLIPVQIHDLYSEDKALVEKELGGILRAIEFIYKSTGVNRPLRAIEDHPHDNMNKTYYRDQINKVANAIDEIIHSLKGLQVPSGGRTIPSTQPLGGESEEVKTGKEEGGTTLIGKVSKKWLITAVSIALLVIAAFSVYTITESRKKNNDISKPEKSVAVLPFVNDSPDTSNIYLCNGMMDDILTQLQKIGELNVKSRTSAERFRNSGLDLKEIGKQLEVAYLMEGSVRKIDDNLRITVQLVKTENGNHIWAETYDGKYSTAIFDFQSNIAKKVASSVNAAITPLEEKALNTKPTTEILAHDFFMKGEEMLNKWRPERSDSLYYRLALNFFNRAIIADPTSRGGFWGKYEVYLEAGKFDSAMFYLEKLDKLGYHGHYNSGKAGIYFYTNNFDSAYKYNQRAISLDFNLQWSYLLMGQIYFNLKNDVIACLPYYQKAFDFGGNSSTIINSHIAGVYFSIGDYNKALNYYRNSLKLDPKCGILHIYGYTLSLLGKYNEAHAFLDSICGITPCEVYCNILRSALYTTQKKYELAEQYYDKAIKEDYISSDFDKLYIACVYKKTGRDKEAIPILNDLINRNENLLKGNIGQHTFIITLSLAAAYAMQGDKSNTLRHLSELEKTGMVEYYPCSIRTFPGFDDLRNDPEFNSILLRIENNNALLREKVKEMERRGELTL